MLIIARTTWLEAFSCKQRYTAKLFAQRSETETIENSFETVLFQFRVFVRTDSIAVLCMARLRWSVFRRSQRRRTAQS